MVGFVRFAPSPRHVELAPGRELSAMARGRARRVLLAVDPTDQELEAALEALDPDLIQLHGAETPDRVRAIGHVAGRPVVKAIGVAEAADLDRIAIYRGLVDGVLLDAKPPRQATRPGGHGATFDWRILDGYGSAPALDPGPWTMLSGGLTATNVAEAIAVTRLDAVDVSSGVETRPGEKDAALITAFVEAARTAFALAPASRRDA